MKKLFFTYYFLILTVSIFSQSKNETVESVFSKSPISLDFIENQCLLSSPSLYSIFNLNVFEYFELDQYDTDLKRAMFKKTTEYQNYLSELINIKSDTPNSIFYIHYPNVFLDCNYNTAKKGFDIVLCSFDFDMLASNISQQKIVFIESPKERIASAFSGAAKRRYKIEEKLIRFKSIPSRTIHTNKLSQNTTERLFISMSEENGLEIEENKDDIDLYLLFAPNGIEQLNSPFLKSQSTKDVLFAEKARLIICNKKTGSVYYDKIF